MKIVKKIKAEIEKRLALQSLIKGEFAEGSRDALNGLLSFIETLEESEYLADTRKTSLDDLVESAMDYQNKIADESDIDDYGNPIIGIFEVSTAFEAGAKWAEEQMKK